MVIKNIKPVGIFSIMASDVAEILLEKCSKECVDFVNGNTNLQIYLITYNEIRNAERNTIMDVTGVTPWGRG